MLHCGKQRVIFIPGIELFFDKSIRLSKNGLYRWYKKLRFDRYYSKQIKKTINVSPKDSHYDLLLLCKECNYKVVVYQDESDMHNADELRAKLNHLLNGELIFDVAGNIDNNNIDEIVQKYDAHTPNSIFITTSFEIAKTIHEMYSPDDIEFGADFDKIPLFKTRIWGKRNEDYFLSSNVAKEELINLVSSLIKNRYINYSKNEADFTRNQVIYIGNNNDENARLFVETRYSKLKRIFEKKHFTIVYFPKLQEEFKIESKVLSEVINYMAPSFGNVDIENYSEYLSALDTESFYSFISNSLDLPLMETPGLLVNLTTNGGHDKGKFEFIPLGGDDIEAKIFSIDKILSHLNEEPVIYYSKIRLDYDAEREFDSDGEKLSSELKQKIDLLYANGKHKALAELALQILVNLNKLNPELAQSIKASQLPQKRIELSKLTIDENYRVFLDDYGNMEIKMTPLPKTVFLFFLKHPEGIMLHDLVDHKRELLSIYNRITNSSEPKEIEKRINELVDMSNNSINEKCSRIKEAFVSKIDDSIAKHYYITGKRNEPKRIMLEASMINYK